MVTISVSRSSIEDWKYIAEGGSTIVFAYVGPANNLLSNKVLRLRKVKHQTNGTKEDALAPPLNDLDDPAIVFQQAVIRRLVPDCFLPSLEIVSVDKKWIRLLAEAAEDHRPEARRSVDRIDWDKEAAVLADNLIGGSGLAVEIKVSIPRYMRVLFSCLAHSRSGASFRIQITFLPSLAPSKRVPAGSACTRTRRALLRKTSRSNSALWICTRATSNASGVRSARCGLGGCGRTAVSITSGSSRTAAYSDRAQTYVPMQTSPNDHSWLTVASSGPFIAQISDGCYGFLCAVSGRSSS